MSGIIISGIWIYQKTKMEVQDRVRKSNLYSTNSMINLQKDPNLAMINAAKAIEYDLNPSSLKSFYDSYYSNSFIYRDKWFSPPFYKIIDKVEEKGDEMYIATYTPNQDYIITSATSDYEITLNVFGIAGKLIKKLTGHDEEVQAVKFHQDTMVSVGWDGKIIIWSTKGNPENWKIIEVIMENGNQIYCVDISEDGKHIIIGNNSNEANIYSIDGKLLNSIRHSGSVNSVDYSVSGSRILTASKNTGYIWSNKGVLIDSLAGHENDIKSIEFSPDENSILTTSNDKTIKLWSNNGKLIKTLREHDGMVRAAHFSPDGEYVISGSNDNKIILWEKDGSFLTHLIGHKSVVYDCNFSPDMSKIISASGDGTAMIWDLNQKYNKTLSTGQKI